MFETKLARRNFNSPCVDKLSMLNVYCGNNFPRIWGQEKMRVWNVQIRCFQSFDQRINYSFLTITWNTAIKKENIINKALKRRVYAFEF